MKKTLSLSSANLVYLITMLLIITVGSTIQMFDLSLGLIATELFLILLPAVVFLAVKRIPLKDGLRLNPIKPAIVIICLLLGISVYLFSIFIEIFMMKLSGMPPVILPEGSMPEGTLENVLYFIALAVAAPLCEEALFRGAIQGSYESRKSAILAVTIPTLMFAFYHMRLSGLPGLIPVSFVLGYVAWRTRSILGSILVHVGMNASSAAITLLASGGSTLPDKLLASNWTGIAGIVMSVLLLLLFIRIQPKPQEVVIEEEPKRKWAAIYWPLVIAFVLYAFVVTATVISQAPAKSVEMVYNTPNLSEPVERHYQAINRAGENVGEMDCVFSPQGENLKLDCTTDVQAYEAQVGSSYYADSGYKAQLQVLWDVNTFNLLDYHFERIDKTARTFSGELKDGSLVTTTSSERNSAAVSSDALLDYEWPWRITWLKNQSGLKMKVMHAYLSKWDDSAQKSFTVVLDDTLTKSLERINLPSGKINASKLMLSGQTAWYTDSGYPVQFDDGMLTFTLAE